jgi:hypothetical protein
VFPRELLTAHCRSRLHTQYAFTQPLSSAVTVAIAFAQHFSRPFAYTVTKPISFSALKICTPLSHATLCITVASSRFTVAITSTQWPAKLHSQRQIAVARKELYTQSHTQGCITRATKCKGKKQAF